MRLGNGNGLKMRDIFMVDHDSMMEAFTNQNRSNTLDGYIRNGPINKSTTKRISIDISANTTNTYIFVIHVQ